METKLCKKCNLEKDINDFRLKKDKNGKYYRYSYCKQCENANRNIYDIRYREKHNEEIKCKAKLRIKSISLQDEETRAKYYQAHREYYQSYISTWRKKNKDKVKQYYMKDIKKRNENTFLRFKDQIRHEILRSFKAKGLEKNKHTEEIVGIEINKLYLYLKETFKNNYGYEWDGVEKVHIDHIIPLSIAKTKEDIIKLCYYTNLQLLKEKDNLKKHNKINWEL